MVPPLQSGDDAAEPESEVEEGALDDFEDRLGRLMRED